MNLTQTETLNWFELSSGYFDEDEEFGYEDEVVATYRDFQIALCNPNGGIVAMTIWNSDKSIIETVDTEEFDKYGDEDWHIEQAKVRINQLLSSVNQLSLL